MSEPLGELPSFAIAPASRFNRPLPSLRDVHVLVLGDVMLDRYWFGVAERISQEAPVPVVDIAETEDRPGGAANTALNIVSMGARCTLIGAVGDDAAGQALEDRLTAAGVHCDLVRIPDWSTIVKLRIVSRQRQLLRVDFEEAMPSNLLADAPQEPGTARLRVEQELAPELLRRAIKHLGDVSSLVLQDYDKGAVATPEALIEAAHVAGVPVVVDPKHKPLARYVGADLVSRTSTSFALPLATSATTASWSMRPSGS